MNNLFLLLAFLSFLATIYFGVRIVISYFKKNKLHARKMLKLLLVMSTIMVVSFVAFGVTIDPEDAENTKINNAERKEVKKLAEIALEEANVKKAEDKKLKDEEESVAKLAKEEKKQADKDKLKAEKATADAKLKSDKKIKAATKDVKSEVEKIIHDKIGVKAGTKKARIVELNVSELTDDPDGQKYIIITLNASENLTNKMTRRKMWMDSADILEPLSAIPGVENILVEWMYPLGDQYGNVEDGRIMMFSFSKEVYEKMNWDNFDSEKLPNVVSEYFEHPALSK